MRSRKSLIQTALLAVCLIHAGAAFGSGAIEIADKALKAGQLTISGPEGFHVSQAFKAGDNLSASMFDKAGQFLADGLYKWSIVYQGEATGDRGAYRPKVEPVTGSFTIKGGAVVNADAVEVNFNKDQQILDDLIVVGSICAGQDCNNGESFGFDTLRLKENNLRIKAQDTSTSASFPTRDWQITFNDSSNGGANKFSIDDIDGGRTPFTIEGGAPSHSLFVDDGGRIGNGTSTPVTDFHIKSGNTPTVRLEQDGSSGFGAQTWDLAGNEANFFIRDASNGSTLPFRIFPGAPSNAISIEATTGDVGLGTTAPTEELHILAAGGANAAVLLDNTTNGGESWTFRSQSNGQLQIRDSTNIPFRIGAGANQNLLLVGVADDGNTAAPGEVNITGDLIISGNCTETDGACADYVFEPGYEYPSLAELADFIADNKHLPNVPSEAEMKQNGVNMSHLSGRLLEKIEELVLYTLEQQEQILDLQSRLKALEGTND